MPSLTINATADGTFDVDDPVWKRKFKTSTGLIYYQVNFDTPTIEIDYVDGVEHTFRVMAAKTIKEKNDIINALYAGTLIIITPSPLYRKRLGKITVVYDVITTISDHTYQLYARRLKGISTYGSIESFTAAINDYYKPQITFGSAGSNKPTLCMDGAVDSLQELKSLLSSHIDGRKYFNEKIKSITITNGLFDTSFEDADILPELRIKSAVVNEGEVTYVFYLSKIHKFPEPTITFNIKHIPITHSNWMKVCIDRRGGTNKFLINRYNRYIRE